MVKYFSPSLRRIRAATNAPWNQEYKSMTQQLIVMGRTGADDDFVSGMWIKERSHISEAADLTGLPCQNRFLGARELYKPSFGVIETVVVLNSKKRSIFRGMQ